MNSLTKQALQIMSDEFEQLSYTAKSFCGDDMGHDDLAEQAVQLGERMQEIAEVVLHDKNPNPPGYYMSFWENTALDREARIQLWLILTSDILHYANDTINAYYEMHDDQPTHPQYTEEEYEDEPVHSDPKFIARKMILEKYHLINKKLTPSTL